MTIAEKLKQHFTFKQEDYWVVGGDALLIVGYLGFVIECANPDLTRGRKRYEPGEKIFITRFTDDAIFLSSGISLGEIKVPNQPYDGVFNGLSIRIKDKV